MKGGIVGSPGVEDTRKAWPIESTKKGSWELTETEKEVMEPARSYTRSSAYKLRSLALGVSGGLLTEGVGCLWLFCLLLGPFPPTGLCCPALMCAFVLFYLAIPCLVDAPGKCALFWRVGEMGWIKKSRKQKNWDEKREGKFQSLVIIWEKNKEKLK